MWSGYLAAVVFRIHRVDGFDICGGLARSVEVHRFSKPGLGDGLGQFRSDYAGAQRE